MYIDDDNTKLIVFGAEKLVPKQYNTQQRKAIWNTCYTSLCFHQFSINIYFFSIFHIND